MQRLRIKPISFSRTLLAEMSCQEHSNGVHEIIGNLHCFAVVPVFNCAPR